MSDPIEEAERRRRREYCITARLLKEYTARLYRVSKLLGEFFDAQAPMAKDGSVAWTVILEMLRYRAIQPPFRSLTLFTSQMLVHYELDAAEANELRLRLADADNANESAKIMASQIAERHGIDLDFDLKPQPPTVPRPTPKAPRQPLVPAQKPGA